MTSPSPAPAGPRTVFIVSDGTGITAETFSHSILAQFETRFRNVRIPFVDTIDKAHLAVRRINDAFEAEGVRPIVFTTLVDPVANQVLRDAKAMILNMFQTFIEPLENELGLKSTHAIGRLHQNADTEAYKNRIEAINFSLMHDDGQSHKNLAEADVILVGVSRSGKTPTSLYLAMQYGLKSANYPLIPDDFERGKLPSALLTYKSKIFGLTIDPARLSEIRNERRPGSKYAALENCRYEVNEAEAMMRREGITWLSTTHKSIEEIATTILQEIKVERDY
ncbi:kinase/pyrophosphorylase [Imbroritus primus]|uniref:Kinase/pyrophosphorylase n=1 Tax=Imbroritus primus TaxID=3058603 RepID=A0ACD3SR98_9BURK|nr:kinase/pyrophosphorylase [Burkholderiaceae bacterium PBA]